MHTRRRQAKPHQATPCCAAGVQMSYTCRRDFDLYSRLADMILAIPVPQRVNIVNAGGSHSLFGKSCDVGTNSKLSYYKIIALDDTGVHPSKNSFRIYMHISHEGLTFQKYRYRNENESTCKIIAWKFIANEKEHPRFFNSSS